MNKINLLGIVRGARIYSVNHYKYSGLLQQLPIRSMSGTESVEKTKERQIFLEALPSIIDNLTSSPRISQLPEIASWLKKLTSHTLHGGKHLRGLMITSAYQMMEKPENITEENKKLAKVLGWCIEFVQTYFTILDDIMDNSPLRRGAPSWHLMPNIGMCAINDSVFLATSVNEILEIYFSKMPIYTHLLQLFHEATILTAMGQHIDFTTGHYGSQDAYKTFTVDRYNTIIKYKTSRFSFKLPPLLALSLVKDVDERIYACIDSLAVKFGSLYHMQDDYIDCFGDITTTGKKGTDIQERKCTWLAVHALALCNDSQKELFTKYYGSKEPEHEARIKKLYSDLQIEKVYKQKEKAIYDDIVRCIKELPTEEAQAFYSKLIGQVYKRIH